MGITKFYQVPPVGESKSPRFICLKEKEGRAIIVWIYKDLADISVSFYDQPEPDWVEIEEAQYYGAFRSAIRLINENLER